MSRVSLGERPSPLVQPDSSDDEFVCQSPACFMESPLCPPASTRVPLGALHLSPNRPRGFKRRKNERDSSSGESGDELNCSRPLATVRRPPPVHFRHCDFRTSDAVLPPRAVDFGGFTSVGGRSSNEDAYSVPESAGSIYGAMTVCCAVFDGHGGGDCSKFAANTVQDFVRDDPGFETDLPQAMVGGLRHTDAQYYSTVTHPGPEQGSTALVACIRNHDLHFANLGDCRAVGCRAGQAVRLTEDHNPSSREECQRVEKNGMSVVDGYINCQLGVSRALGDYGFKKSYDEFSYSHLSGAVSGVPDVWSYTLCDDMEFVIMASDGLWRCVTEQQAVAIVRSAFLDTTSSRTSESQCTPRNPCVVAAKELVDFAVVEQRANDNVTVVCLRFRYPGSA